jgi:hypothetical protein
MFRHLVLLCFLLAFTTAAQSGDDKIYKWTDDNGEVHYTQQPPQNRESVTVRHAPPPPGDPEAERKELQQDVEAMEKQQQEQAEKVTDAEQWSRIQQARRKNCATARRNLAELQQGGIKRYRLPSGEVVRLDEEDRQKRIAEANKQIEENCTP